MVFSLAPKARSRGAAPDEENGGEDGRDHQLEGKASAQNALGDTVFPLAHMDGGTGRAAGGDQSREGRDDHDEGHTDPHAGQSQVPVPRHMADVDAVHYVVEHIDELGDHRGEGQAEQELPDGGGAQKGFLFFHVISFFAGSRIL